MNRRLRRWLLIVCGSCTCLVGNAPASVILDQAYEPITENAVGSFGGGFSEFSAAQTFTVGLSGILSRVDLFLNDIGAGDGGSVDLAIFSVVLDAGRLDVRPGFNVPLLSGISVPDSSVPSIDSFVAFDLASANFAVTAGQQLALVLTASAAPGNEFQIRGRSVGGYANGQAYHGQDFADPLSSADFGFRTFVDVATVPEPSTTALLALGLLGSGFARKLAALTEKQANPARRAVERRALHSGRGPD